MSERSPNPNRPRLTDEELIDQEIKVCTDTESTISPACARMIASQIHDGQASSLYSFASTGRIDDHLLREIELEYVADMDDEAQRNRIAFLSMYVAQRWVADDREAQDGWPALWLEQPDQSDYCPCCSEHISANHRVGCPLGVDDEQMLSRVQELQAQHGNALLHWLNYVGFRTTEELEDRARQFPDYYYGFFPSVEVFRQNYEVSPNAYLEQQYEIVEGDGGVYVFDR